jgi:hypothetical protein
MDIVEFCNDIRIKVNVQQIFYYYKTGLWSKSQALLVCKDLKNSIDPIEKQLIQQTIINSKNNAKHHFYNSDLITMSNAIMQNKTSKSVLWPFYGFVPISK